jgi:Zn-dependent protease
LDIAAFIYSASTWVIPVVIAITLHEAAHGWAAWKLGDDTAYRLNRVSFNPIRHIDPLGTLALPAFLFVIGSPFMFGWAKPVPVAFGRLNNPRRDMVWVAAAGPGINLLLALIGGFLVHVASWMPVDMANWSIRMLANFIQMNLLLAVFNLIPLPPLDGGRIAVGLLPDALAFPLARLERFGMLIIIGAFVLLPMVAQQLGYRFDLFTTLVQYPVSYLMDLVIQLAGLD